MKSKKKKFSAEPTEENFREQAQHLDTYLQHKAKRHPNNPCRNIRDYVATFYKRGAAKMTAQIQLGGEGYLALASPEGVNWLVTNYSPE